MTAIVVTTNELLYFVVTDQPLTALSAHYRRSDAWADIELGRLYRSWRVRKFAWRESLILEALRRGLAMPRARTDPLFEALIGAVESLRAGRVTLTRGQTKSLQRFADTGTHVRMPGDMTSLQEELGLPQGRTIYELSLLVLVGVWAGQLRRPPPSQPAPTPADIDFMRCVLDGCSRTEAASRLGISAKEAAGFVTDLCARLMVTNPAEAMARLAAEYSELFPTPNRLKEAISSARRERPDDDLIDALAERIGSYSAHDFSRYPKGESSREPIQWLMGDLGVSNLMEAIAVSVWAGLIDWSLFVPPPPRLVRPAWLG